MRIIIINRKNVGAI